MSAIQRFRRPSKTIGDDIEIRRHRSKRLRLALDLKMQAEEISRGNISTFAVLLSYAGRVSGIVGG